MKQVYLLDGAKFQGFQGFVQHFNAVVLNTSGHQWNGSLDAFNDILRGGFGTPDTGFILVWKSHQKSMSRLGAKRFEVLVEIIRNHGPGGTEAADGVELRLE